MWVHPACDRCFFFLIFGSNSRIAVRYLYALYLFWFDVFGWATHCSFMWLFEFGRSCSFSIVWLTENGWCVLFTIYGIVRVQYKWFFSRLQLEFVLCLLSFLCLFVFWVSALSLLCKLLLCAFKVQNHAAKKSDRKINQLRRSTIVWDIHQQNRFEVTFTVYFCLDATLLWM